MGAQRPELRSKSMDTCARTSTGGGVISRGTFVPFVPRPGGKPGGGGCWKPLMLQVDKGGEDGRVGDGKEKEETTVAVLLTARQNGGRSD